MVGKLKKQNRIKKKVKKNITLKKNQAKPDKLPKPGIAFKTHNP